jgi:hypothetical protein
MYFQYITELYNDQEDRDAVCQKIKLWLLENVGTEGSARQPLVSFDWGWSLTRDYEHPAGIYFVREEDKMFFRLTFGISYGNRDRIIA